MKNLKDYGEEIHKCSKCGLCQSVCPVYKVTGNDCSVSRGKFIMLGGIVKGDLKLNKNVNKYLDMCLKCNACKDFCPSDIDARKIFLTAKAQYFSNSCQSAKFLKVLHSPFVFNLFLNCAKIGANTYRFLRLDKLAKLFYPILGKFELGKKAILANEFVASSATPYASNQLTTHNPPFTIIYFKGCVNQYINPRTKIATENILNQMGVKVVNVGFQCCGVPFLSSGNVEQFVKQAEFNLAQIPDEFDYFITDCASCQNAFFEYENYIRDREKIPKSTILRIFRGLRKEGKSQEQPWSKADLAFAGLGSLREKFSIFPQAQNDEKLLQKLKKINEKSINVVDFVVKNAKSFEFEQKTSFTFHKPCHLEDLSFLQEFLTKTQNVEYIEMKDFDKCCGFSGEFAIKNPEISQKISSEKIKNAHETKADYVLTSCPSCILGLTQGFINHSTVQPFNLSSFIEFLSKAKITT